MVLMFIFINCSELFKLNPTKLGLVVWLCPLQTGRFKMVKNIQSPQKFCLKSLGVRTDAPSTPAIHSQ